MPVSMLKTVVLPAPLGPMRPTTEPAAIFNERSETAFRPAKLTVQPRVSSKGRSLTRPPRGGGPSGGPSSGRRSISRSPSIPWGRVSINTISVAE